MKVELIHNGFMQQTCVDGKPFLLKICTESAVFSEKFNALSIKLDASPRSTLNWHEVEKKVKDLGIYILWELDFGFFSQPFLDEPYFLGAEIAIEHFLNTIWSRFQSISLGAILYRGSLKKYLELKEDLKLLASRFPEELSSFLLLDTTDIQESFRYFSLARQDAFGHFYPILKGRWAETFPCAFPALAWDHGKSPYGFFSDSCFKEILGTRQSFAIHLPDEPVKADLEKAIIAYAHKNFRMIPDMLLTQEWEGIDDLLVFSKDITERTKRKLLGFCAAGGRVISFGPKIGLPNEILYEQYPIS